MDRGQCRAARGDAAAAPGRACARARPLCLPRFCRRHRAAVPRVQHPGLHRAEAGGGPQRGGGEAFPGGCRCPARALKQGARPAAQLMPLPTPLTPALPFAPSAGHLSRHLPHAQAHTPAQRLFWLHAGVAGREGKAGRLPRGAAATLPLLNTCMPALIVVQLCCTPACRPRRGH